jgi:solute carrier family 25 phosphate transporter 23/24/25/41
MYLDGGVRTFWRGNGMNCVKIIPESAIKFYVFEKAKRWVAEVQGLDPNDSDSIGIGGRFVAGGIGGLVSQFSIYPIETIKTRLMAGTPYKKELMGATIGKLVGNINSFAASELDMCTNCIPLVHE